MATVLVVEDNVDTRDLVVHYLIEGGHDVALASNGWEAILAMEQRPVDLILLDLMMPGMDGAGFLRIHQHSKNHAVPVVVLSAMEEKEAQEAVRGLNVAEILPKAGDYHARLLEIVGRYAGGARPE